MKVLLNNKWTDVLDQHCDSESSKIEVIVFHNVDQINDQYFIRKKSILKIYYYIKEIGFIPTVTKILSRWRERYRNEKYLSLGIGKIIYSEVLKRNEMVCFVATNHAKCSTNVVVCNNLVFKIDCSVFDDADVGEIHYCSTFAEAPNFWRQFNGWTPWSGLTGSFPAKDEIKENLHSFFRKIDFSKYMKLPVNMVDNAQLKNNMRSKRKRKVCARSAVLFGLGNYAKTCLLPNVDKRISINKIHEIDPLQMLPMRNDIMYDTCPFPRGNESFSVFFIAGFHHTHAELAIYGLNKNADVVVEKPLVTTDGDLHNLIEAMRKSKGRLYASFQKRYHKFNQYIHKDLGVKLGDPICYYATVYEELLPKMHWYRWPNSKSAIISNGCHWVDHFFFINNFCEAKTYHSKRLQNNEILVSIELVNGAVLILTLSHLGSPRIGVQEYIELRANKSTIKISNSTHYFAESETKIIRKSSENKYNAYRDMYKHISKDIVEDQGLHYDTVENVSLVSSILLELDAMVAFKAEENVLRDEIVI